MLLHQFWKPSHSVAISPASRVTTSRGESPIDKFLDNLEDNILYFFMLKNKIVLVHALNKKDQKLRNHDIDLAERRMKEYEHRFCG